MHYILFKTTTKKEILMKNPINTTIAIFLIFSSAFAVANPSTQSATKNVQHITECSVVACKPLPINFINPNLISSIATLPIINANTLAHAGYESGYSWFYPYAKSNFIANKVNDNGFYNRLSTIGLRNLSSKNLEVEITFQRSFTSQVEFLAKITIQPRTTDFVSLKENIYVHRVFYRFSEPVDKEDVRILYEN